MSFCKNCGKELNDKASFCPNCDTSVNKIVPAVEESAIIDNAAPEAPVAPAEAVASAAPVVPVETIAPAAPVEAVISPRACEKITEKDLPDEFKPLGPWRYFWLDVLYGLPIIGFIFLIINSFNSNVNKKNHARSQWIPFFICLVWVLIMVILALVLGASTVFGTLLSRIK